MVTLVARAGMDFHSNRVAPVSADSTEKNYGAYKNSQCIGEFTTSIF